MKAPSANDQPAVTVVIPTYNHATFLKAALDSVQAQTCTQWEAVVVNNYSEDDTVQVVEGCGDPRIRLVNFSNEGIIGASRNEGVRHAHAPLVAFLDSDDVWYPEKLEKSVSALGSDCDVVCHNERLVFNGVPSAKYTLRSSSRVGFRNLLFFRNCLSPSAVTLRKAVFEKVGGFSEERDVVTAEDYELWLKLARASVSIRLLPEEILGEYHVHGSNSSGAVLRHRDAVRKVVLAHFRSGVAGTFADHILLRRRLAYIDYVAARGFMERAEFSKAGEFLRAAWRQSPWLGRTYYLALLLLFRHLRRVR